MGNMKPKFEFTIDELIEYAWDNYKIKLSHSDIKHFVEIGELQKPQKIRVNKLTDEGYIENVYEAWRISQISEFFEKIENLTFNSQNEI